MKYLVTGGAGFIGSHLCEALINRGDFVVCVDDFNNYYDPALKERNVCELVKQKNFVLYRQDITDFRGLERVFAQENPDKTVHLAARAGVRASLKDPLLYSLVNVQGTVNVLELSKKYGVKQVVFASSSSVYGEREDVPFKETDRVDNPVSYYAATKKAGELFCHSFAHNNKIPVTCLRFFTVFGPRGRPDMAPYKFISAVSKEEPITMFGDGSSMRDYTYIDDIISGVLAALDKPFGYEIINLGNSRPVLLKDFVAGIERVVGKKARINHEPVQEGDVSKTFADVGKAKKLLGWQPSTPLEEGLKRTYEYLKSVGKAF